MHPAYSVIFFTTASGAGYGLLCLLSLGGAFGWIATDRMLGFVGLGLALALISVGLVSSTAHLGRPERAWRAFSQWRSSWLSREGVLAVATFPPAGITIIGWGLLGRLDGTFAFAALATAILAVLTVVATGQIYATLPTIKQWHQPTTTPVYVTLALATGALLLNALVLAFGHGSDAILWLTAVLLLIAHVVKIVHWQRADSAAHGLTAADATGLAALGRVRPLDPPHTQPNFVMREMGYAIGRKHAARLRMIATLALFGVPLIATILTLPEIGMARLPFAVLAVMSATLGLLTERWLFFAEARHIAMLYYGAERA